MTWTDPVHVRETDIVNLSGGQAKFLLSLSMASRGTIDCMQRVESNATEKCQPSQSQGISVISLQKKKNHQYLQIGVRQVYR